MIVCHCLGLTDRTLRRAIRSGARTPADLAVTCGASSGCGGCAPAVAEVLADELRYDVPIAALCRDASAPESFTSSEA